MLYFIIAHTEGDNTMIIIRENVLLDEKQNIRSGLARISMEPRIGQSLLSRLK